MRTKSQNEHLIKSLKAVITALENQSIHIDETHSYTNHTGLVVCAVLGISEETLREMMDPLYRGWNKKFAWHWTNIIGVFWPMTANPKGQPFSQLHLFGLTAEDMCNLDNFDDEKVLAKVPPIHTAPAKLTWFERVILGKEQEVYGLTEDNLDHFRLYLEAWIKVIEEETPAE